MWHPDVTFLSALLQHLLISNCCKTDTFVFQSASSSSIFLFNTLIMRKPFEGTPVLFHPLQRKDPYASCWSTGELYKNGKIHWILLRPERGLAISYSLSQGATGCNILGSLSGKNLKVHQRYQHTHRCYVPVFYCRTRVVGLWRDYRTEGFRVSQEF